MARTLFSYFCVTEDVLIQEIRDELNPPTVCVNNAAHTINTGSIQIEFYQTVHIRDKAGHIYVEDVTVLNPVSLTPTAGQSWLINGTGAGDWFGYDDNIATWDGSNWYFYVPEVGESVHDKLYDNFYIWNGALWTLSGGVWVLPTITKFSAVNLITTTSTTMDPTGVTLTPAKGTYLASFEAVVFSSVGATQLRVQLFLDGVAIDYSFMYSTPVNPSTRQNISTQAQISANGSQAVDVRFSVSGGTMTMVERSLILIQGR